jgi:hypothetical protein
MQNQRLSVFLIAVFSALAGFAPEAHAYLDPSTGSMILSAIVGLFATAGLALKTYWYKLRRLLIRRPEAGSTAKADAQADESGHSHRSS